MTRDEATEYLIDISYKFGNISVEYLTEKDGEKMREAINVLTNEQQTCEDAVSRSEAIKALKDVTNLNGEPLFESLGLYPWNLLNELPSVQPKPTLCEDAVSREAVLGLFAQNADAVRPYSKTWEEVKTLPPVNPQLKVGHWIEQIDHEENCRTLICSNCDRPALHDGNSIWKHKFCPHCGAKMVEPQESEDKCSNCAKSWTDNCPRNKCWDNDYSEFIKEREVSE